MRSLVVGMPGLAGWEKRVSPMWAFRVLATMDQSLAWSGPKRMVRRVVWLLKAEGTSRMAVWAREMMVLLGTGEAEVRARMLRRWEVISLKAVGIVADMVARLVVLMEGGVCLWKMRAVF